MFDSICFIVTFSGFFIVLVGSLFYELVYKKIFKKKSKKWAGRRK